MRPGRKLKPGAQVIFGDGTELTATIEKELDDGKRLVRFHYEGIFLEILERLGKMPLPPYIKAELQDNERYQTVYSKVVAPPLPPLPGSILPRNCWKKSRRWVSRCATLPSMWALEPSVRSRRRTSRTTRCIRSTV